LWSFSHHTNTSLQCPGYCSATSREWVFIDGSYAKAHQHSTGGAAGGKDEGIGKNRAGNTRRIHLAVDAYGLPIAFDITGGQINDCTQAPHLIAQVRTAQVIVADKGYDSESIREQIERQGARVVIPRKRNSVKGNVDLDRDLYRYRHLVENTFARLKTFRAIASRFDKLKRNYESVVAMACCRLWLPK
jgi:transposase